MRYLVFKDTFRIFEDSVTLDCQLQYLIMDKTSFAWPIPICRFQYISQILFLMYIKKKHLQAYYNDFKLIWTIKQECLLPVCQPHHCVFKRKDPKKQKAVRKYYQRVINAWYFNLLVCKGVTEHSMIKARGYQLEGSTEMAVEWSWMS